MDEIMCAVVAFLKDTIGGETLTKEQTEEFLTSLIGVTGETYDEVLTTFVHDMKAVGIEVSLTF